MACDPAGYQYFVTALLSNTSTNPLQESVPSNIVSNGGDGLLTGCYMVTNFAATGTVQGSAATVAWTLQDDYNPKNNPVTTKSANTLVAIGPLPGNCTTPTFGRYTLLANGTPTNAADTFSNNGNSDNFTFMWNSTDSFCAGSYTLRAGFGPRPSPSWPTGSGPDDYNSIAARN